MYLHWHLPFFKTVPPRLTFFLFSNLGLIMAQQTSIPVDCFMAGGWYTLCFPISKVHIAGEGPGETPSALTCLSYPTSSFLNDIKHLAKTSKGALFLSPSDVYVRSFPYLYYTLIKLCYTQSSKESSLISDPGSKSSPPEVTNSGVTHSSQRQPFTSMTCMLTRTWAELLLSKWEFSPFSCTVHHLPCNHGSWSKLRSHFQFTLEIVGRKWQATPVFLTGKILQTEERDALQPMGSQKVRHDWAHTHISVLLIRINCVFSPMVNLLWFYFFSELKSH